MPLIKPLARYFSIPSRDVGGLHLRNVALNCSPCSLSCTQLPRAVIHSPALMLARAPTTVTSSRWPFTFTRSTANPVSSLWKVTRSINPENPSWGGDDGGVFTVQSVSMGPRPCHSRSRHFHQTVAMRSLREILSCGLTEKNLESSSDCPILG